MAERIPTEEVERLVADGELLPIVTAIGADAHLRLRHQRRDLAADLLDARRENERLRALTEGDPTSIYAEAAGYREALKEIVSECNEVSSYTKGDLADIARAALSGEETR